MRVVDTASAVAVRDAEAPDVDPPAQETSSDDHSMADTMGSMARKAAPYAAFASALTGGRLIRLLDSEASVVRAFGGPDAVRVVARHAAGSAALTPYGGASPWAGVVRDLQVLDPSRVPTVGRLFSEARGNVFGRWGALADDVAGQSGRALSTRFNLGASTAAQIPDAFAPRSLASGDVLRVGAEGARAYSGGFTERAGTFLRRLVGREPGGPLQIEFTDYPGRAASAAQRAAFEGNFVRGAGAAAAAEGGAASSFLRGAGRVANKVALPLAVGLAAWDVASTYREEGGFGEETRGAAGRGVGGIAGGIAGSALAGAALGSIVPGAGTAVGFAVGAVGGLVGGLAGAYAGEAIGRVADDAVDAVGDVADAVGDAASDAADGVGDAASDVVDAVGDVGGSIARGIGSLLD